MATYKRMYRNGDGYGIIHMIIGYRPINLQYCIKASEEIVKDFPFVGIKDIEFGKVFKSTWCNGFFIATWSGKIPKPFELPNDWVECDIELMDYYW